ncbi:MAG: ATP-dependent Clp protease proteolytic subunit [Clostridia bacterium]|nr:ATP-dependent Clp protease proteolytic subunit [Clostridia bacterium]
MIEIKLHDPIGNESNLWMYWWDGYEGVFSLEFVQKLFEEHPDETDFKFNIHCPGGEVEEGLAIYDALRTSGKNIHMNIEGGCHSMAVTLLLAAPLQWRTANPNCRALIHRVQSCAGGTPDELAAAAEEARQCEESILDIYADRTGQDKEFLRGVMAEQKERTAQELLEWGFIGSINAYNTNFKSSKGNMAKKTLKERTAEFISSIRNFVGSITNYEFVDDEGEVLFTTEADDDTLEVGMAASPDGTFTLPDGRTVTIADGVITEITEPEEGTGEGEGEGESEEVTALRDEIARLTEENESLKGKLGEAANLVRDYQRQVKSTYEPKGRVGTQNTVDRNNANGQKTSEQRKAEIRENLQAARKNRK